jgi:hypothetical protein
MRRGSRIATLAGAALVVWAGLTTATPVLAQTAAPDSSAVPPASELVPTTPAENTPAPADTSTPAPESRTRAARAAVGADNDRFELGAAIVDGPFDAIGTFAYHRFVRRGGPFENWAHVEISGGKTDFLKEGTVSAAYLLVPLRTVHHDWRIRPILAVGPGAHLVVQVADVQGFNETAFHARGYLKLQTLAGLEAVIGARWGLVARGRLDLPAHRPLDYAQIALFFR